MEETKYRCSNCGEEVVRTGAYYKCPGCGDSGNINEIIQKQSKLERLAKSEKSEIPNPVKGLKLSLFSMKNQC